MIDITLRKDTCFSVYHETNLVNYLSFIVFFQLLRAFKYVKGLQHAPKTRKMNFF